MKFTTLFSFLFIGFINASAQTPEGYFAFESSTLVLGDNIVVSIKKYNPTPEEIRNAANPPKNAPLSYLQAPPGATGIKMYDRNLESKLYCLNKEGNLQWSTTVGFSNESLPGPIAADAGFLYTGECLGKEDKVVIEKLDASGKVIWQTKMDSLHHVNSILIDGNKVNALVSFDASEKIDAKDGTYSVKKYPIYFFVQLDIQNGTVIKKEYQRMANYLSSIGFSNAVINTDRSYYLNNKDSAIFLDINKQTSATVVSENMSKENTILKLAAGFASNHYLTLSAKPGKTTYTVISDFYGQSKKYQSELPVTYARNDGRYFILKNEGDSILTVINSSDHVYINYTDIAGKSNLYKEINGVKPAVIGAGLKGNKVFLVTMEGRNKPGEPGKLKINYY